MPESKEASASSIPEEVIPLKDFLLSGRDVGAELADGTLTAVPPQELGALPNLEEMLEKLFDGVWEQIRVKLRSHNLPEDVIEAYLDCVADGYGKRLEFLLTQGGITGASA